jgi:ABC-type multidrug transport system fused ATPase/permease subunit
MTIIYLCKQRTGQAQQVAVVIDGRLVEIGPQEELLARGGEYSRLWHAWHDD